MSWLNLNQSLNSLKGQITNFATEVLSEGVIPNSDEIPSVPGQGSKDLEEKCQKQEQEIAALKKLTDDLQAALQAERLSRKNGVKEEESSWYWDPPPQNPSTDQPSEIEVYKLQIQALQDQLSTMRDQEPPTQKMPPDGDEINKLREENKNLATNLEDLDNQHQMAMERLLGLKKELQKNFEVLKQEHEDLKNSNDDYAQEVKAYQAKIAENEHVIQSLQGVKAESETIHHKYQNLERIHSLLRENAENFQEENQELHEEVFKLQEQVTKLEHEIEIGTKHVELSDMVPRERYEDLLKELNELRDRRTTNQVHMDEVNIDDNAKSVIENLKREINELKHKLAHKELEVSDSDSKIIRPERVIQLYNKYVNFELPVDFVGEIPTAGDNIVLYKLENALKTLSNFKKEKDALEHNLSEKNLNIKHMQTQIEDMTAENDFLTTDIQHFERELSEMKKNNDFLISEIAALKNTSKLEPIIETHEDNLAKLETELADCNKINKTFESEISRIKNELHEVRSEKVLLQSSLADLKEKYTVMLTELEVCKTQTQAIEEMESHVNAEHIEKLQKATSEIDDLKKKLTTANTKSEKLAIDMHIIENDKILLTKEIEDIKFDLKAKEKQCLEFQSERNDVIPKLHQLQLKHDELNKNKTDIEVQTQEMTHEANLQKIINENNELMDRLQKENATIKEEMEKLYYEVNVLRSKEEELQNQNVELKNKVYAAANKNSSLKNTNDDLSTKIEQLTQLKVENADLLKRKLELELELASTDTKILKLEEEFEKLLADLSEKDALIDTLTRKLQNDHIVSDLENTVKVKNEYIETLRHDITELKKIIEHLTQDLKKSQEYSKAAKEMEPQLATLKDLIKSKDLKIVELKNTTEISEKQRLDNQILLEQKDSEIKELNQSIVELTDKMRSDDIPTQNNDEYTKLVHEKETIVQEVNDLKQKLQQKEAELSEIKSFAEKMEHTCNEYKVAVQNATKEKGEIINLVTLKHNESIQYHNEIQRLNHVILEHTNELKRVTEENETQMQNRTDSCQQCENLIITLNEKNEIIKALNQNKSDYDKIKSELVAATDKVANLKEKCENLDKSLAIQLDTVRRLTAENVQLSEQESNSTRELDRLRQHLVETEESYTQELMTSEQKLAECLARLQAVEDRAKQTSNVYTSNSIRANQEVETLRNQIRLLEKQREEVQGRLGAAEDAKSRSEAALTNLQLVLEQFQLDKERDIEAATVKLQNKMTDLKNQNGGLQQEIARLNAKLEESIAGLQAASRLGDQLETKTAQILDLREQVRVLQSSVAAAEARYRDTVGNQQDRVDKHLVKNMLLNYVQAEGSAHNRSQVLRILSTVLDFNQQECARLGLGGAPEGGEGLARQFVRFLERESRPAPPLPDMAGLSRPDAAGRGEPASRKNSGLGPQPNPYEVGHKRNLSTGSNNLLFQNIDALETASQRSEAGSVHSSDGRVALSIASPALDSGVNQTRNTEGAILKHVLKDSKF